MIEFAPQQIWSWPLTIENYVRNMYAIIRLYDYFQKACDDFGAYYWCEIGYMITVGIIDIQIISEYP